MNPEERYTIFFFSIFIIYINVFLVGSYHRIWFFWLVLFTESGDINLYEKSQFFVL
jgi:hypothetical protein